jgi:hypothetical protein
MLHPNLFRVVALLLTLKITATNLMSYIVPSSDDNPNIFTLAGDDFKFFQDIAVSASGIKVMQEEDDLSPMMTQLYLLLILL